MGVKRIYRNRTRAAGFRRGGAVPVFGSYARDDAPRFGRRYIRNMRRTDVIAKLKGPSTTAAQMVNPCRLADVLSMLHLARLWLAPRYGSLSRA